MCVHFSRFGDSIILRHLLPNYWRWFGIYSSLSPCRRQDSDPGISAFTVCLDQAFKHVTMQSLSI